MRWGDHDLYWGRPLKSILAYFDNKVLEFNYHHLNSSNFTYLDKDFEEKTSKFSNFKTYKEFFKSKGIILDHNKREEFIENQLLKKTKLDRLKLTPNKKLLNEVTNIVEKPNIIKCKFDKKFLKIPKEINKLNCHIIGGTYPYEFTVENRLRYYPNILRLFEKKFFLHNSSIQGPMNQQ